MHSDEIQSESISIRLDVKPVLPAGETTLHIKRFSPGASLERQIPPVLMLHGSLSNGRIFYSESGKGLAPFLARLGYDVYVGDLRGRGKSRPRIAPGADYGQNESIRQEIPAMIQEIRRRRGEIPQHWVAHSWGGVLLYSVLARFPEFRPGVRSLVLVVTRRSIRQNNWSVFWKFHLFWHHVGQWLARKKGYLPAREWKFGADNETLLSLAECSAWVKPSPWIDTRDGFDYGKAIQGADLPPSLWLAGAGDTDIAHPRDVRDFAIETGSPDIELHVLGKRSGNTMDYGHSEILTHPKAADEVFPLIGTWLGRHDAGIPQST